SLLLLRGRSSRAPANAEMTVTEEGTPAPPLDGVRTGPPLIADVPTTVEGVFDANAELSAARAARDAAARRGLPCPSIAEFNDVASHAAGTTAGWDATFEAALCYESLGDFADAKSRLIAARRVEAHKARVIAELAHLSELEQGSPRNAR
ncbi:MAG: hypothetical protein ACREJ3_16635, partial [Polyangiaceae bacterium]